MRVPERLRDGKTTSSVAQPRWSLRPTLHCIGMNPVSDLVLNPVADLVLIPVADMGSGMDLNPMADM